MRKVWSKIAAVAIAGIATTMLFATPASAHSEWCRGECTVGPIPANPTLHFIDAHIINDMDGTFWCSWVIRDYDTKAVVGSGTTWTDAGDHPRVYGLYGRYTLFVSNYNCSGEIENNY